MKTFSSVLATTIRDYLTLKRALGREYEREEWVLARLDCFLAARHADLIAETFAAWCLTLDRKSTRLNSSHSQISYAVFCLKKKKASLNSTRLATGNIFISGQLQDLLS